MWAFKKKKKEYLPEAPKEKLVAPNRINTFRYTYEPWHKENPKLSQLDFEKITFPDNLFLYLTKLITNFNKELQLSPNTNYSIIPIDDSYYKWLEDHNMTDSLSAKGVYCNSLSDEEIYQRMVDNGWEEEYEIVGIPLYAINSKLEEIQKTSYKLEDKLKSELLEYLENIYGKNVYLPGYILTQNDFYRDQRDFIQIAKLHFRQNTNVRFIKWEEQKYSNKIAMVYPLVIPFVVRRRYESPVLNYNKLLCDVKWQPVLSLKKDGLSLNNIDCPDFKDTSMYSEIKDYFGPQTIIMESIVRSCDIPDINREILSKLNI